MSSLAEGLSAARPVLAEQKMRPTVCHLACRLSAYFAMPARAASASPCRREGVCAGGGSYWFSGRGWKVWNRLRL